MKEIKVAQLAGYVSEHSSYHHAEASLSSTIVGLAQNFVGNNNINFLYPAGQFGTRAEGLFFLFSFFSFFCCLLPIMSCLFLLSVSFSFPSCFLFCFHFVFGAKGGEDAASPRYIFTQLCPITRLIFHPHDDHLLKYLDDDGQLIEPEWYIPILPMALINGADGIGTGYATKIPNYNPRDVVANLKRLAKGFVCFFVCFCFFVCLFFLFFCFFVGFFWYFKGGFLGCAFVFFFNRGGAPRNASLV